MTDDSKYIYDLISEGEHQQLDFKFEISNAKKIAKTLVAFGNTDGGRLLIGVKDNGKVKGIRTEEEYYMIEAAASLYCKPKIAFDSFRRVVEGKVVLEIVIKPSEQKPHYSKDENGKWLAYHRVLDNNFLAEFILLQVWKRENRSQGTFIEYSEKEKEVLNYLEEVDELTLEKIVKHFAMKKKSIQNILVNLISVDAVKMIFKENKIFFTLC